MLKLMDCTLRDGANVVGKGFNAELTRMMLEGLSACGVDYIELGNAGGIGAYEVAGFTDALADEAYLELVQPYLQRAQIGMFLNAKRYREQSVELATDRGLAFLRVGVDADESELAKVPIRAIKSRGLQAFYSAMKAYLLTPKEIAETAKRLEDAGLDEFTIMDSAGCMLPDEVSRMTEALVRALHIPVAFHGHNNLGLSAANSLAAYKGGASILDCGLMGMARSAGNLPTEVAVALLQKSGELKHIDLYRLLDFIDRRLEPAMKTGYSYTDPILPFDLALGMSGAHSSFGKRFRAEATKSGVNLFRLVAEVSAESRKNPSEELIRSVAASLATEQ